MIRGIREEAVNQEENGQSSTGKRTTMKKSADIKMIMKKCFWFSQEHVKMRRFSQMARTHDKA